MKQEVTKAIILVGGWGTRLRPLTYTVPKPLVSFCNKPILKYQIEKLVEVGIKEIILALNYHSEKIIEEVEKYQEEFGIEIVYSKEEDPLGTAGPLALARDHLVGTSFFLLNSDICCNADLRRMKSEYMKNDYTGSILVYEVQDPTKYGLIKTDGNMISSFMEKPKTIEGKGPWMINAGIYILSDKVLDLIELREMSIEKEIFPKLAENKSLGFYKFEGYWMDIGQPKDYLIGQKLTLQSMTKEEEGINRKDNVVLGRNVKIGENVRLKNCTLFDYTVVENNVVIEDSIIGWGSHIKENSKVIGYSVLGEGTIVEEGSHLAGDKTIPNSRIGEMTITE